MTQDADRGDVSVAEDLVTTVDLKKYFTTRRGPVKAVDGVNLSVAAGTVFGFLGPNGAGKTTTLRILTTLIVPDSGRALVAGHDVVDDPNAVRRRIGYVSQAGGSDRPATGRENLILQGRLYDMTLPDAEKRADALIVLLDLTEFADRIVYTYSGGQRRRLDVALGIMHEPSVLFMDEPTTGLDPQNRANLWEQIRKLKSIGTTIFLTTHYLEEADALSDTLAIMDYGRIVAEGTPAQLKKEAAPDTIRLTLPDLATDEAAVRRTLAVEPLVRSVSRDKDCLRISVGDSEAALPRIVRALDDARVSITGIGLSVATLDDVFLAKTGRSLRDTAPERGGGGR